MKKYINTSLTENCTRGSNYDANKHKIASQDIRIKNFNDEIKDLNAVLCVVAE